MKPGDIRKYGKRALVIAVGIWVKKDESGHKVIHMTGDKKIFNHISVTNNNRSKLRYHKTLFDRLEKVLKKHNRWIS